MYIDIQFVYMICIWGLLQEGAPTRKIGKLANRTGVKRSIYVGFTVGWVKPKPLDNCVSFYAYHGLHAKPDFVAPPITTYGPMAIKQICG